MKTAQIVEPAADKLERLVRKAQHNRAETRPTDGPAPRAPSGPQFVRPKPKRSGGLSPWLVVGAALAGGYVLAKVLDWRGHAHPRV